MLLAAVHLSLAFTARSTPLRLPQRSSHVRLNFLDDLSASLGLAGYPEAVVDSEEYRVKFRTTAGAFTATVDRENSPDGVDRFISLVRDGFFTDQLLYRVIPGFLIQFGVASEPGKQQRWDARIGGAPPLADEPNRHDFRLGTISFAGSGYDSRSCHIFIALEPYGTNLGKADHEATLGWVDDDCLDVLERIVANFDASGYPDTGALQDGLVANGNAAAADYPLLDRIEACEVIEA